MGDHTKAIAIGASAGAMPVIKDLIRALPESTPPVIIVQHLADLHEGSWLDHLSELGRVKVKEADEKESILPGTVYLAPGNYHLLVEKDQTFSLSMEGKVNYARPSITVLFESAAEAYGSGLIGVILSGGNDDGAQGARCIREYGGLVVVQAPLTADVSAMPEAAIRLAHPQYVLPPKALIELLVSLGTRHIPVRE